MGSVLVDNRLNKHFAGESQQAKFYFPQLDALRFLAFFLVFVHHNFYNGRPVPAHFGVKLGLAIQLTRDTAGFGLSLFFVLSAYLITSLLVLEKERTGSVDLHSFYVRRILRIWPLYFLFLGCAAFAGHWFALEHMTFFRLLAMLCLAGNWYAIAAGMGPNIVSHLWSISVEEQFYAIWPTVFRCLSLNWFTWFLIGLGIASLTFTWALAYSGASSLYLWLNSGSEAIFFVAGALLAIFGRRLRETLNWSALISISAGIIMLFAAEAFGKVNDRTLPVDPIMVSLGYLFVAIGCVLILEGSLKIPAHRVPRGLVYLGKISYGLYVFHPLGMRIAPTLLDGHRIPAMGLYPLLSFVLTVGMAGLSYQLFERRFLRLKQRFERVKTRPL